MGERTLYPLGTRALEHLVLSAHCSTRPTRNQKILNVLLSTTFCPFMLVAKSEFVSHFAEDEFLCIPVRSCGRFLRVLVKVCMTATGSPHTMSKQHAKHRDLNTLFLLCNVALFLLCCSLDTHAISTISTITITCNNQE